MPIIRLSRLASIVLATLIVAACGSPTPTPMATPSPAAAIALPGRLVVLAPGQGSSSGVVKALDMATGAVTPLWPVFEAGEDGATAHDWAIAPDGSRVAYVRKAETGDPLIRVRGLSADAAPASAPVTGGDADVLRWAPDGSGLYYGKLFIMPHDNMPMVGMWELHRVPWDGQQLGQDAAVGHMDEAMIDMRFPRLAGFDPASHRAVVVGGPGENFFVDTVWIVNTATNQMVALINTHDEGFQAAPSPDGKWVAYGECLDCTKGGFGSLKVLDVAAGRVREITPLRTGEKIVGLRWSPDSHALAWTVFNKDAPADSARYHVAAAKLVNEAWKGIPFPDDAGSAVAFAPDASLLLGTQRVYDLANKTSHAIPWQLPDGISWDDAPWKVLGWVPAATAPAATVPAVTPAATPAPLASP